MKTPEQYRFFAMGYASALNKMAVLAENTGNPYILQFAYTLTQDGQRMVEQLDTMADMTEPERKTYMKEWQSFLDSMKGK